MPNRFSSGKHSIALCDRCGQQYPLKKLRALTIKLKKTNILCCPTCWDPDQPQLLVGMYPIDDPQAVRDPRPDIGEQAAGLYPNGYPSDGYRVIQWGWQPVGGSRGVDAPLTPNDLVTTMLVSDVTITIT